MRDEEEAFSISSNLVFRGVVITMFAAILALSGYIGSEFVSHLNKIDNSIDSLDNEYGQLTYRVIRLEDKTPERQDR